MRVIRQAGAILISLFIYQLFSFKHQRSCTHVTLIWLISLTVTYNIPTDPLKHTHERRGEISWNSTFNFVSKSSVYTSVVFSSLIVLPSDIEVFTLL